MPSNWNIRSPKPGRPILTKEVLDALLSTEMFRRWLAQSDRPQLAKLLESLIRCLEMYPERYLLDVAAGGPALSCKSTFPTESIEMMEELRR